MGKPFKKELSLLNETYNWAKTVNIDELTEHVEELLLRPTFVVGSGGSFSACHMFSLLQQSRGTFSKPITPLELHHSANSIRNANVFFVSASGRNSDILFAYNQAVKQDPRNILGLCLKIDTKLKKAAQQHSISKIIELNNPAGKDGFLATNSLVAYFTILSRMFGYPTDVQEFCLSEDEQSSIISFVRKLDADFSLITLYAGWGQPVAIDVESKFTEAGLGNVLFSDFRNFGHGRHNWFDKKKKQSAILSLVTPEEQELANKTLSLLPEHIPKLVITTDYSTSISTIDLLIKSFYLASAVGDKVGIDPGRPGVPSYGSKLYNLKYLSLVDKKQEYVEHNAILRKTSKKTINDLGTCELAFWRNSLIAYKKKINDTKFGALVLDYDGTLCTKEERKGLPSAAIIKILNDYVRKGFIIGIVTGRGKSIRESLIQFIHKDYQANVIVGYYNGAIIAPLTDESQPDITAKSPESLQKIYETLNEDSFFRKNYDLSLRPLQLTIETNKNGDWPFIKQMIIERIIHLQLENLQILESVHSIDIIVRPQVSKRNINNCCVEECVKRGLSENFICIGDKGKFPGNDYELLESNYSLSVEDVSSNPHNCWNLSNIGNRGVATCLQYLNSTKFSKNHFTLTL